MNTDFKLISLILAVGLAVCLTIIDPVQISSAKVGAQRIGADKNLPAAEEWYLQTEDKTAFLYMKEFGKGTPVVVLHGGPGADHRYMTAIANGLDQFRFVFYDQRGSGLSFCAKENISMEKSVQDLEILRKALGVEKLNLISHSFGTMLAMNYLQAYPQNVENIVLLGALDPKNGNRTFFTFEELERFAKRNDEIKSFNERPEVQAEIAKAGLDKPNLTPKQEFQVRRIKSAAGSIYHIERWQQNIFFIANRDAAQAMRTSTNFLYDWSKMLAGHPFPITVINGEYDYTVGSKGSPIWRRVIVTEAKNLKLVLIDKASHNSWIDDPIAFRNALRDALTRKK